ncbi:hypothetical protein CHUAL_008014 [Chamberlinius hualienensis]
MSFKLLVWRGWLLAMLMVIASSKRMPISRQKDHMRPGLRDAANLTCSLSPDLINEIAGYRPTAELIADSILNGPLKGLTYQYLADFVDKFGSRLTGTQNLEDSIDFVVDKFKQLGFQNVHTENATVPIWRRGNESLFMLQPRYKELAMLGLGGSIGTPVDGITGEIIVVNDVVELAEKASEIPGKIVVYNEVFTTYSQTVNYREFGASMAAQYGAVAALLRSIADFSIYSPHTGWMDYYPEISPVKIPIAAITIEDAEMFRRMTDRGDTVTVSLYMEAQSFPDGISRNTIADYSGTVFPEQVVVVSGHIDSWDVGQGAMDDGGGVFISIMAPYALSQLGLPTKRPVRTILWTSEETGNFNGAYAYAAGHVEDLPHFQIMLESDDGTFNPLGFAFSGSEEAACIVQEVLKLTDIVNATQLTIPDDGSDTPMFSALGVPTASLVDDNPTYHYYHHSDGDTMTVLDPDELDRCLVLWTVSSYVFANITQKLPR